MNPSKLRFFSPRWYLALVTLGLLLGLGIRAYDITDLPLDFHPTRQLHAAIVARGMYYETLDNVPPERRAAALASWRQEPIIEPQVMERLAAWGYRLVGGEHLWIPRLLSAIFWVAAGLAVLLLSRELGAPDGGVVAMFYLLFVPYAIYASRTFQPDPLMVCLIAWALWATVRWRRLRTLQAALLAGLLVGLAIYVKSVAVFFLGGALVGMILAGDGLRKALRDRQVWALGVLSLLPVAMFYVYGLWIAGFLQRQLNYRFFPELWRDPAFYIRWQEMATNLAGFGALLAALLALGLTKRREVRGMLLGLWLGYAAYSLTFPYHTLTHDYYQLPLILMVAIGLGVAAEALLARLQPGAWTRWLVVTLLFGGAMFKAWDVRVNLARRDYRGEAVYWESLGEQIPSGARVLSLAQNYGFPLSYFGWTPNQPWLTPDDLNLRALAGEDKAAVMQRAFESIAQFDYFVVTRLDVLADDPALKAYLYDNFPVIAEGDGYLIFDLQHPNP